MYNNEVQYSATPPSVSMLIRPDGYAEYRLTQNVREEQHTEGEQTYTIFVGEEVYFEVPAGEQQPTAAEVEAGFAEYWNEGQQWPKPESSSDDRISALEKELAEMEAAYTEGVNEA